MSSTRMRDKLLTFLIEEIGHLDYVFLTGDIRSANVPDNRFTQEMVDFLKDICSRCGIVIDRLFIVPGNHDINRDVAGRHDAIENVKFKWNGYYDPFSGKIKVEDLNAIWNGLEDLRNFLSLIYSPDQLSLYQNPIVPHFIVETEDFNIIHLDSTITYTKDQEAHDLIVGNKYLYNILKNINKKKPSILLTHYPITSLLQDEKKMVSEMLRDFGVRLWLCGHEHDQNLQPYKYLHMLQSGEVQYEKNGRASFFVGQYDPDTFRCEVNAYAWFPEGWAKYPFVDRDGDKEDTYKFELRPLETDTIPLLTKKSRQANESSMDRLPSNLDRNLFCDILIDGVESNIEHILGDSWKLDRKNVILLGEEGMGKSTMLLDFCKNTPKPTLYISAEHLASLGLSPLEYIKLTLFDGNESDFNKVLFNRYDSQSLIVIVDGLNEVDPDNERRFINEIQRLNLYRGIQVIIASRTDFTVRYNLNGFKKTYLKRLNDVLLQSLFSEKEWEDILANPNLHRLLSNPMLLTIYKEICSIIDEYRDVEFLDWILPVRNSTDLFHNYYIVQIALMMKRHGAKGEKILIAMVCIDQILPAIAYAYETSYSINKNNNEFRTIISDILKNEKINEEVTIGVRDFYRLRKDLRLNNGNVTDMLIDELHLLHRDNRTTSFVHQMYRDYLSSRYIINKTNKNENVSDIWNTRRFPLSIVRHIRNGSGEYWTGTAVIVKAEGEIGGDANTLIKNLFDCFPSSKNSGVADYSNLNLVAIELPNLKPFDKKVSLEGSIIGEFTLGINKKEGKPHHLLCISSDHHFLAAASGTSIDIYNLHDNSRVFRYNIGKIPTQMTFYDRYLIMNAGVLVVFCFDGGWRYAGEISTGNHGVFSSKLKAIVANDDDLYVYYNNHNLKFNLTDCSRISIENKNHNDVSVVDGTSLIHLRRSVDVRKATEIIEGVVAFATIHDMVAKSYADGRIEISNEGELVSVLGERSTILLDAGISSDGSKAVTLGLEIFGHFRRIQIWDLNQKLKLYELLCDSSIMKVSLSENGRWILGETESSTWIYNIEGQHGQWIDELFVSNQHGKLITYGDSVMRKSDDGRLYLFNLDTNKSMECSSPYKDSSIIYPLKSGQIAAVDKSGRYLKFNNDRDGGEITIYPDGIDRIVAIQEFKNKPFFAVATHDGRISVYHTGTGQRTRILDNNFKVRLTTRHIEKTIMAHSDRRNHLTIDYFYEKDAHGKKRGWWHHYPFRGKIDSTILDFAFNEQDNSLVVILANGKMLFLSEDRCQFKGNAHIIVAFNTDSYDFNGAICSKEIAETLKQNNCKCDNLIIE